MIALLLITTLFIFISVYFFFRAEKLQRALAVLNRDTAKAQKENNLLSKSITLMAGSTEEFTKNRFQLLLDRSQCKKTTNELTLIKPFIDNYSFIFKACLMKREVLHSTTKKCFSSLEDGAYKNFIDTVIKADNRTLRLWNGNNFIGFISLVEALLVKYEQQSQDNVTEENTTEMLM